MSEGGRVNWGRLRLLLLPALIMAGGLLVFGSAGEGPFGHANGTETHPGMILASGSCGGPSFCVTSPTPGPVLYPGAAASSLPLTFSNPLSVPIRVYSLAVSFTNTFPSGCAASALQINGAGATGATPAVTINLASPNFSVPAASGSTPGTAVYPATLALSDNRGKQDACKNLALSMSYTASAYYTVTTSTALAVTTSPVVVDQPTTLKATVAPSSAGQSPVGSVQFYQCASSTSGCTTAIGSPVAVNGSGVAVTTTTFNSQGSYYLEAVFTPTDSTNFTSSTSSITTATAGYSSCITASQNGGLTVASGQTICITSTGRVNGSVTVNSGGALIITGGTVNGGVTASSGSTGINLCGASVNGGVTVTYATGPVVIGSPTACAGNTIKGGVTVANDTGGVTVNGNSVSGGVTVSNNSGPSSSSIQNLDGNTISGGLTCGGNVASLSNGGKPNSVSGSRSGQCAGSF